MNRKTTQLLAILLVVTLSVVLYTPGVTRAQEADQGMGLIPSSPARYAASLPPGLKVGAKVPAAVDLSPSLPPVGDQGSQDSSVAWATTYYYKTFQEEQERAWGVGTDDHQFSPAMTYNMRIRFTPNDCSVDEGMRFPDAMDILLYDGALPLATFPYSDTDTCTQPIELAEAAAYRSLGYGAFFVYGEEGNVSQAQVDALKAHLANGDLLVMGIPVYAPSFTEPVSDVVGVPGVGETLQGFHAVTIVGYDDAVGGFQFVNSWGPSYAGDGFAYLSYDFVMGHALEAWWMYDRMAAPPAEGCAEGTVLDIEDAPVADATITLEGPASWTGTTNISGTFATGPVLPLGTYTVSASKPGFAFTPGSAEIVVSEGDCAVQNFIATEAVLWVDAPQETLFCGETATITIGIRDVVNLYGVQFDLTFDPTVIEVIDPDGDPGNGIIVPGDIFPTNEFEVAYEQVDNVAGSVEFAISLLRVPKAPPFAGSGTVAEITVRALGDGVSPLVLLDAKLANSEGQPIDALTEVSSIAVECRTAVLGYAYLESRTVHDGITVTLEGAGLTTLTDANGSYAFNGVPSGTFTATFEYDEFLDVEVGEVVVVDGLVTELCGYTLLAGDLNNDEVVDILDLSLCAAEFGSTSPDADVNADGIVDIYDLVLIGKNFKLASPQPGVCTP